MVYSDLYDYSLQTTAVYNRSLQAEYIWFIGATYYKKKIIVPTSTTVLWYEGKSYYNLKSVKKQRYCEQL